MDTKKRSKHKISSDELTAEYLLNKIPQALMQLQQRGFLLPKKEHLKVDTLFVPLKEDEKESDEKNAGVINQQFLNVFERHEKRLANALPGLNKTTVNNGSVSLEQLVATSNSVQNSDSTSWNSNTQSLDSTSWTVNSQTGVTGKKESSNGALTPPLINRSGFQEPQKILSLLSNANLGESLGEKNVLNFQVPDLVQTKSEGPKIEIGKLIEQVNIHSQDISGGSQQLVKILKEKLVEILKDELNTTY